MSIIAAGTTTTTALSSTGNTDGTLQFQVNGTTASVTLNTLGAVGVGSTPAFGTAGQVLTSGGSTVAPTWTTIAASQWTTTGSDIYYNTGNVGIGTASPSNRLSVVTASGSDGFISVKSPLTDTAGVVIDGGTTGNKGAILKFSKDATVKWQMGTDSAIIGATSDNFHLYGGGANAILFSTNAAQRFVMGSAGQLGIGASPSYGTSGQVLTSGGSGAAPTWSSPAGVSVFTGSFTRDLTTASGSQAITGVGFVPKAVLFTMSAGGGARFSDGFDTQTARGSTYTNGSATFNADSRSIVALTSGSDFQYAQIATMDADGFTLTWTKTGSPTGSATIKYLAIG
jgi:hypothetical protein